MTILTANFRKYRTVQRVPKFTIEEKEEKQTTVCFQLIELAKSCVQEQEQRPMQCRLEKKALNQKQQKKSSESYHYYIAISHKRTRRKRNYTDNLKANLK